jgi:hypothetical protein
MAACKQSRGDPGAAWDAGLGGSPFTDALSRTPAGVHVNSTAPTSLPSAFLSEAFAVGADTGTAAFDSPRSVLSAFVAPLFAQPKQTLGALRHSLVSESRLKPFLLQPLVKR